MPATSPLLAPAMLDDMEFFLGLTDLTLLHFAQGMDIWTAPDEIGMLGADGKIEGGIFPAGVLR